MEGYFQKVKCIESDTWMFTEGFLYLARKSSWGDDWEILSDDDGKCIDNPWYARGDADGKLIFILGEDDLKFEVVDAEAN
ncbi:hypothetical protein [Salmonella phage SSBI34]|nr:hypothetical protein [Salmonella phage SSBI34]